MNSTADLAEKSLALADDPRFAAMFAHDRRLSTALWLLELGPDDPTHLRLMYGRIIAAPRLAEDGTTIAKGGDWQTLGDSEFKYRFYRVVITGSSDSIRHGLKSLFEGRPLGESFPDLGPAAKTAGLRLGANASEVAGSFAMGPVRFLTASPPSLAAGLSPLSSPSNTEPVFVASAIRLRKISLFETKVDQPLPGADDLARNCLEYLESQTGLHFTGIDCRRLGNVEWLSMPSADDNENSYVSIETDVTRNDGGSILNAVKVVVRPGGLPVGTPILVRCRVFLEREIGADTCIASVVDDEKILSFPVPGPVNRVLVTIWKRNSSGDGEIWFEHDVAILREINIHMGLSGLHGSLESDWTRSLVSARHDTRARIDKVRSIGQVSYEITSGGGDREPWEQAERDIEHLPKKLFPPKSGAQFFLRGWDNGAPGLLGFVEWFRQLTEDPTLGTILLTDPYFDVPGITEFLARARGTHIEYVILTNSQLASKDDLAAAAAASATSTLTQRAERLARACHELTDILSRLRFKLLDLRSKGKGSDQLFHDRYILLFSRDGALQSGFQLSNSLQLSSKGAPLLVTCIPDDILERVGAYVGGLLEADHSLVGKAEITTVSSTENLRAAKSSASTDRYGWLAGAGDVMSRLYGRPELAGLPKDLLATELQSTGASTPDGQFERSAIDLQRVRELVDALPSLDWPEFVRTWTVLGEWGARFASAQELLSDLVAPKWNTFAPLLERYVTTASDRDPPSGFRGVSPLPGAVGLGTQFRRSFSEVLSEAKYFLRYHDRSYGFRLWGLWYAIRIIRSLEPSRLVQVGQRLWELVPPSERETDNSVSQRRFNYVVGQILDALVEPPHDESLTEGLLLSSVALFRALGVHVVIDDPVSSNIEPRIRRLGQLAAEERLNALAEWAGDLRVQSNRNKYTETEDVRAQRVVLFDEMVRNWPHTISANLLREIVGRMSGPGEGSWATSTTREFLLPLVQTNRLKNEEVEGLWFTILDERIAQLLDARRGKHNFYAGNDGPLSEAWAIALSRCGSPRRATRLEALAHWRESARRQLAIPFARSNYSKWSDVCDAVRWLKILHLLFLEHAKAELPAAETDPWKVEMSQVSTLISGLESGYVGPAEDFLRKVEAELHSRAGSGQSAK